MQIKLGNVADWYPVEPQEVLQFDTRGPRRLRFSVNATAPVQVWLTAPAGLPHDVFLGMAHAVTEFEVHISETAYIEFRAPEETAIYVSGSPADHRVKKRELEAWTSVAPQQRQNNEFYRMMLLAKHNAEMREAERDRQFQAKLAELATPKQEPTPEPIPEPKPEPTPETNDE